MAVHHHITLKQPANIAFILLFQHVKQAPSTHRSTAVEQIQFCVKRIQDFTSSIKHATNKKNDNRAATKTETERVGAGVCVCVCSGELKGKVHTNKR